MRKKYLTKNVRRVLIIISFGLLLAFSSQRPGAASDDFKQRIAPIFERSCTMCHGASLQRSGLDLRSEESILKGGARGPAIVPGNAEKSLLYKLIAHKEEPAMPMGMEKLAEEELAAIAKWINGLSSSLASAASDAIPVREPGYSITDKDRK